MDDRQTVLETRLAELASRRGELGAEIAEAEAVECELKLRCATELEQIEADVFLDELGEEAAEQRRVDIRSELATALERTKRASHALPELERRIESVQAELAQVRLEEAQERAAAALRARNTAARGFGADVSLETCAALEAAREQAAQALSRFVGEGGDASPSGPLAEVLDEPDFRPDGCEALAKSFEAVAAMLRGGPLVPCMNAEEARRRGEMDRGNQLRQDVGDAVRALEGGVGMVGIAHYPERIQAAAVETLRLRRDQYRKRQEEAARAMQQTMVDHGAPEDVLTRMR